MPFLASNFDGAQIHYRVHNPSTPSQAFQLSDGAAGKVPHEKPTLVFSHGFPMSSRMFDHLILPLVQSHQYRCVSFDRRGFGKSDWTGMTSHPGSEEITYDVLSADLAKVLEVTRSATGAGFIGVGASMGCGELVHALQHRTDLRAYCRGLVFLGSNLPNPVYDAATNPKVAPPELWDSILAGLRDDRQNFIAVALAGVFGAHVGHTLTPGQQMRFERIADEADVVALERCVRIINSVDFTEELRSLGAQTEFPLLVVHGDSDQGFALEAGPERIPSLVPRATLKVYEKAAHGLYLTHKEQCVQDILQLLQGTS